jgi:hypothetical protein
MSGPFFRPQLRLLVGADPLSFDNLALNAARTAVKFRVREKGVLFMSL